MWPKSSCSIERAPKQVRNQKIVTVSFGNEHCEGVQYLHDDALVVTLLVANYTTRRILIDNGSSANTIFWDAFTKMGINLGWLCLLPTPLKGFSGDAVQHVGAITLPVTTGKGLYTTTTKTNFLVDKAPSSYNAILGCLTLNSLNAVTFTYHLKMKFLTEADVGEVREK